MLSFCPRGVLDEIWNLIESVSEDFPSYSCSCCYMVVRCDGQTEPPVEYRDPSNPVVFHNLRGYDSHLLMQAISKVEGRVSCIPNNTEKNISFSLGQLRFIDSAQFLLASPDKLVAANSPGAFQITAQHESNRELLMRKSVYPYEYMATWDRFTEPKRPPQRKPSTASSPMRISVTRTAPMRKRSGRPLGARPRETTATCTVAPTSCFWQMSLRRSVRCASTSTA